MVRNVKIISNNYNGNNLVITISNPENNSSVNIHFDGIKEALISLINA